jgi:hypothetical protein
VLPSTVQLAVVRPTRKRSYPARGVLESLMWALRSMETKVHCIRSYDRR